MHITQILKFFSGYVGMARFPVIIEIQSQLRITCAGDDENNIKAEEPKAAEPEVCTSLGSLISYV